MVLEISVATTADREAAVGTLETELSADALAPVNAYNDAVNAYNDAVHAALPPTPFLVSRRAGYASRARRPPLGPRPHGHRAAARGRRRRSGRPGDQQPGQRRGLRARRLADQQDRCRPTSDHLDHAACRRLTQARPASPSFASRSASATHTLAKSPRCRLSLGPCARESGSSTPVTRIVASG